MKQQNEKWGDNTGAKKYATWLEAKDMHGGTTRLNGLHVFTKNKETMIGASIAGYMHCINYLALTKDGLVLTRTSFGGNFYPDGHKLESTLVDMEGWHHELIEFDGYKDPLEYTKRKLCSTVEL